MFKGFRDFITRGNVVDLAVGIVIGAAFGALINQFVASFIDPLVRLATGGKAASGVWHLTDDVSMDWAAFVNQLITFVLTAAAVYFVVVVPINRLNERRARAGDPAREKLSDEARILTEIRDSLRRDGLP
jgi:large conductance mechanosensitive channel